MKSEIPQMLKQGVGAIVNNASMAGLVGFSNAAIYCASKQGVIKRLLWNKRRQIFGLMQSVRV